MGAFTPKFLFEYQTGMHPQPPTCLGVSNVIGLVILPTSIDLSFVPFQFNFQSEVKSTKYTSQTKSENKAR